MEENIKITPKALHAVRVNCTCGSALEFRTAKPVNERKTVRACPICGAEWDLTNVDNLCQVLQQLGKGAQSHAVSLVASIEIAD